MKSQIRKLKKKISKYLWTSIIAFHLCTQVINSGNDLRYYFYPSKERTLLKKEFNVNVSGWREDIEDSKNLGSIADVAHREQLLGDLELNIQIPSRNYLKKSIFQQMGFLLFSAEGSFNTLTGSIEIQQNNDGFYGPLINDHTLIHEAKHQRTYNIMKTDPNFIAQWESLSVDENGKSLYYSPIKGFLARFRGINHLVRRKESGEKNENLGFVSNYARTNVYEDIAELCTKAEELSCIPSLISPYLFDPKKKNARIIGKTMLAQEYGLIPEEFFEYAKITYDYSKLWEIKGDIILYTAGKAANDAFLEESSTFLQKYPNSVYLGSIRHLRGDFLYNSDRDNDQNLLDAIKEGEQGLKGPYKGWFGYGLCLGTAAGYNYVYGNAEKSRIFEEAREKYRKKLMSGDILATKDGIDNFLIEKGVLAKP